jgi:uncharacterized membrane protein YczE
VLGVSAHRDCAPPPDQIARWGRMGKRIFDHGSFISRRRRLKRRPEEVARTVSHESPQPRVLGVTEGCDSCSCMRDSSDIFRRSADAAVIKPLPGVRGFAAQLAGLGLLRVARPVMRSRRVRMWSGRRVNRHSARLRLVGSQVRGVLPPPHVRRITQLFGGLVLYGISSGMLFISGLGLDPWDVFHQGLARRTTIAVGNWVILVGAAVLVLWIPLRQRPGIGTLANVVVIGLVINAFLAAVPAPRLLWAQALVMLGGVGLNGVATGAYIGAGLGPGPRDGLMTGLASRGWPIRRVRTLIELTVLVCGWRLGGTVGLGTVVYAVGIGPLAHVFVPLLAIDRRGGS